MCLSGDIISKNHIYLGHGL